MILKSKKVLKIWVASGFLFSYLPLVNLAQDTLKSEDTTNNITVIGAIKNDQPDATNSNSVEDKPIANKTNGVNKDSKKAGAKKSNLIELNFNELDLKTMVDLISKATGTAFLYEDNLTQTKKITLLSTGSYSLEDAYKIFENILDINDFATIKEGPYVRIVRKNDARSNQSPVVRSTKRSITQGDFVTMVIPIENTDVNNIRGAITPFLSPSTLVNQYIPSNVMIIRDSRSTVQKTADLIKFLDDENNKIEIGRYPIINANINQVFDVLNDIFIKSKAVKNIFIYIDNQDYSIIVLAPKNLQDKVQDYLAKLDRDQTSNKSKFIALEYIDTKEAFKMLQNFFPQNSSGKASGSALSLVEDTRNNRLLLKGPESEIAKAERIMKEIDIPVNRSSTNYRVFYLKNSDAESVAKTLQQLTNSVNEIANQEQSAPKSAPSPANTGGDGKQQAPAPAVISNNVTSNNQKSDIAIVGDIQTNSVVVFASNSALKFIEKLIADLDIPRPQVFLEVMIMEVSLDKSLRLGIDWKSAQISGDTLIGAGLGGSSNFLPSTVTSIATEGANANIGFLGPSISYNGQSYSSYSGFIQAVQRDTDFNLISNPQILTVANQESHIRVGEVRPFQTSTRVDVNNNTTTSYDYKELGVSLKFTAKIGDDNTVALKVDQSTKNIKEISGGGSVNLTPTTIERSISTNVLAKDKEIIVLGGLIGETQTNNLSKTVCLGDIPILGSLFRNTNTSRNKTNLLVYIKPTIVRTAEERYTLKQETNYYYQNNSSSNSIDLIYDKLEISKTDALRKPVRKKLNNIEDLPKILEESIKTDSESP